MNWDTVKGNWKQFRGKVQEQWEELTDDDLDKIEGKRDQLLGTVQKNTASPAKKLNAKCRPFEATQQA